MPRPKKPASPFRYFNSSPEIIRLVVMMYGRHCDEQIKLSGLRDAQWLRSKMQGHTRGTEAVQASKDAIANFGSCKDHFSDLCARIAAELQSIESQCEAEL